MKNLQIYILLYAAANLYVVKAGVSHEISNWGTHVILRVVFSSCASLGYSLCDCVGVILDGIHNTFFMAIFKKMVI